MGPVGEISFLKSRRLDSSMGESYPGVQSRRRTAGFLLWLYSAHQTQRRRMCVLGVGAGWGQLLWKRQELEGNEGHLLRAFLSLPNSTHHVGRRKCKVEGQVEAPSQSSWEAWSVRWVHRQKAEERRGRASLDLVWIRSCASCPGKLSGRARSRGGIEMVHTKWPSATSACALSTNGLLSSNSLIDTQGI